VILWISEHSVIVFLLVVTWQCHHEKVKAKRSC